MTTTPHTPRLADLLPAWSLGALDAGELRELAAHLEPGCPACDAELQRLAAVVEELAVAAAVLPEESAGEAPEILDGIKQRLLATLPPQPDSAPGQVAASPTAPPPVSRRPWLWTPRALRTPRAPRALPAAAAIAAALALVAVWGVARQAALGSEVERLRGERRQLLARAQSLEQRVAQVEAESRRLARTLSILAAPGVESVRLAAMGSSHSGGRAYVNPGDRKAVFYAFDLPPLAPDKTYQLWYIDDQDRKTSAGTFNVDAHGKALLVVDEPLPVERIQAWAVTLEPRGGMPQPTGPLVLAG
jgi:hypothetical protein